jgi:hypothetical protein
MMRIGAADMPYSAILAAVHRERAVAVTLLVTAAAATAVSVVQRTVQPVALLAASTGSCALVAKLVHTVKASSKSLKA